MSRISARSSVSDAMLDFDSMIDFFFVETFTTGVRLTTIDACTTGVCASAGGRFYVTLSAITTTGFLKSSFISSGTK